METPYGISFDKFGLSTFKDSNNREVPKIATKLVITKIMILHYVNSNLFGRELIDYLTPDDVQKVLENEDEECSKFKEIMEQLSIHQIKTSVDKKSGQWKK